MSGFRRFYRHGSEHFVHLEELERAADMSWTSSARSWGSVFATRQVLAQLLMTLARWIEPTNLQYADKAKRAA